MSRVMLCWIGGTDLKAASGDGSKGLGPIAAAAKEREFDEIVMLYTWPKETASSYCAWLEGQTRARLVLRPETLVSGPWSAGEIYVAARRAITDVRERLGRDAELTYHLSPGSPAMAAVWLLLKSLFPAELIESSPDHGVNSVLIPFDISAEYIPDLLRRRDDDLVRLSAALPPEAPEFAQIVHRCQTMKRVIEGARRVAGENWPVLIEGESGTGKELLALAIRQASPRRSGPIVTVNCGSIPEQLVEAELFGYEKGAFTGATTMHPGHFERAHRGTLFLDEIGELPLQAQVKLLRVMDGAPVQRVGGTQEISVDVRVIAATNRALLGEVVQGRFRQDLFYRLAVLVLRLPPLREREGDLGLLIDTLMRGVNKDRGKEPKIEPRRLAPGARNLLLRHQWPGNVRELRSTLVRAAVWSANPTITQDDVRDALFAVPEGAGGPQETRADDPKTLAAWKTLLARYPRPMNWIDFGAHFGLKGNSLSKRAKDNGWPEPVMRGGRRSRTKK